MLEFKLRCWDERGVVGRLAALTSSQVQLGARFPSPDLPTNPELQIQHLLSFVLVLQGADYGFEFAFKDGRERV